MDPYLGIQDGDMFLSLIIGLEIMHRRRLKIFSLGVYLGIVRPQGALSNRGLGSLVHFWSIFLLLYTLITLWFLVTLVSRSL